MANNKLIHMDSNFTRAKEKAEREAQLNEKLLQIKTDLHDTKGFFLFDSRYYEALATAIEDLNTVHLTNIDIFGLVEVANTMYLIEKLNRDIAKFDDNTEYNEKLKHIASRNGLNNTLEKQLTALQLSPAQRNALLVETQTNMNAITISNSDFDGILTDLGGI